MKTASIISIGDELLKGKMEDINATFISRWLSQLGIIIKKRISVRDDIKQIKEALKFTDDSNLVVTTGGLGPTDDDCTREALAEYLGKNLIFDNDSWAKIDDFFKSRNLITAESNKKQAMIINDGEVLPNDKGTAPGIFYSNNGKFYAVLPGPPHENQYMINNYLSPKLKSSNFFTQDISVNIIRIYNTGESTIADIFKNYKAPCNIGYYFTQDGFVEIHITKAGDDKKQNQSETDHCHKEITKKLDENKIDYTINEDLSLLLLKTLMQKRLTISFAESITGGNISGEFVKNPGASDVFKGGVVVYSNESKIKLLNVEKTTIKKHGAVSSETVYEMTTGLKKIFNTDICISVSGIAGPAGETDNKPVGLVYIGIMFGDKIIIKKEVFTGNRSRIIKRTINYCFLETLKYLK